MRVWELIRLLVELNEDDEVVVFHAPTNTYISAEGVKAENGMVEIAATGANLS